MMPSSNCQQFDIGQRKVARSQYRLHSRNRRRPLAALAPHAQLSINHDSNIRVASAKVDGSYPLTDSRYIKRRCIRHAGILSQLIEILFIEIDL
jgi:hypothetical protein